MRNFMCDFCGEHKSWWETTDGRWMGPCCYKDYHSCFACRRIIIEDHEILDGEHICARCSEEWTPDMVKIIHQDSRDEYDDCGIAPCEALDTGINLDDIYDEMERQARLEEQYD